MKGKRGVDDAAGVRSRDQLTKQLSATGCLYICKWRAAERKDDLGMARDAESIIGLVIHGMLRDSS